MWPLGQLPRRKCFCTIYPLTQGQRSIFVLSNLENWSSFNLSYRTFCDDVRFFARKEKRFETSGDDSSQGPLPIGNIQVGHHLHGNNCLHRDNDGYTFHLGYLFQRRRDGTPSGNNWDENNDRLEPSWNTHTHTHTSLHTPTQTQALGMHTNDILFGQ